MISRKELLKLVEYPPNPESPVLSVYLNVDQSQAVNLNRGFEAALKSVLQGVQERLKKETSAAEKAFLQDAQQVTQFVAAYEPRARSLVIFSDASEEFWWWRELEIAVENQAHWTPTPYVRPLLEARDEFERCGIILTDRARARLFTFFMGEIEEHREALAQQDVRRFDASGSDQMRSQMRFQRKAQEHAHLHLKNVAEQMDRIADEKRFDRLILAGPAKTTSELRQLLSDRLQKRVIGSVSLPIDADEKQILEAVRELEGRVERASEERLVENLITAAAKNGQAVTGIQPTLEALQQGRIRMLVYADGLRPQGLSCPECGALLSRVERDTCPYCSHKLVAVEDLLEKVVERVVGDGGQVEQVRDKAAIRLKNSCDGVGAFLRF